MKKYNLRKTAARAFLPIFLLAYSSFTLGAYSEKASITAWGWGIIPLGIIVFIITLIWIMRDFWRWDD
jgi:hypothetical protein